MALLQLPAARSSVVVTSRSRFAACTPVCAFKVATKPSKKTPPKTAKKTARSPVTTTTTETTADATPFLALTGLSAVAGTALTLAPETLWQLLGSQDVVNVTVTSSQVCQVSQCTQQRVQRQPQKLLPKPLLLQQPQQCYLACPHCWAMKQQGRRTQGCVLWGQPRQPGYIQRRRNAGTFWVPATGHQQHPPR